MISVKFRLVLNLAIMVLGGYWISQNPDNWTGYFAFFYGTIVVFYSVMKIQKFENKIKMQDHRY